VAFLVGCDVPSAREAARVPASVADESFSYLQNQALQHSRQNEISDAFTEGGERKQIPARFASGQEIAMAPAERKIVYQANLRLVVTDFANLESEVSRIVREHDGYLANASIDRTSGEQRSGNWQARIPTDRFDSFLEAASKLGVPESRAQTAQDVTEEFVDLEARISNQKRLEERILQLLDQKEGAIKDVIAVEQELARVRGEIERMEGRLRFLSNRAELTTVAIFAREQRDYVPPQAPTFASRISETWSDSLLSLRDFGANAVVALVGLAPWLVILAVLGILPYRYARRCLRAAAKA
jgi:hypothetical protein